MASSIGPLFAKKFKLANPNFQINVLEDNEIIVTDPRSENFYSLITHNSNLQGQLKSNPDESILIFIAQIIKEDGEQWYGFLNSFERSLFELFRKINGIGPKLASICCASISPKVILDISQSGKAPPGLKIPGLGAKKLQSLCLGLKQQNTKVIKILKNSSNDFSKISHDKIEEKLTQSISSVSYAPDLLVQSLIKYGMKSSEIHEIYQEIMNDENNSDLAAVEILKLIFQKWGQRKTQKPTSKNVNK